MRRQIDVHLLPVGVGVMDLHADLAQPADDRYLFAVPALKEAEHPPVELLTHCPAKREPQIPLTGMTEERGPEMGPRLLTVILVPLIDQRRCRVQRLRDRGHRIYLNAKPLA